MSGRYWLRMAAIAVGVAALVQLNVWFYDLGPGQTTYAWVCGLVAFLAIGWLMMGDDE